MQYGSLPRHAAHSSLILRVLELESEGYITALQVVQPLPHFFVVTASSGSSPVTRIPKACISRKILIGHADPEYVIF
jgi:hypothetical protein